MEQINKYQRKAYDCIIGMAFNVDVYTILDAFQVACPARQHAVKKLLCAGLRGKGDALQDLTEAQHAVARAVELEEARQNGAKYTNHS